MGDNTDGGGLPEPRSVHEAMGRFFTQFSLVQAALEESVQRAFGTVASEHADDHAVYMLAGAAMGVSSASATLNTFMAVIHHLSGESWDDEDRQIVKAVNKSVRDALEYRNRLAHDMLLGPKEQGDDEHLLFQTERVVSKDGFKRRVAPVTTESLVRWIERLQGLEVAILTLSAVCVARAFDLNYFRVSEVLEVQDGEMLTKVDLFVEGPPEAR